MSRSWRSRPAARMLVVGLSFAALALPLANFATSKAIGNGWQWFPIYAAIAALLNALCFWWWIIERRNAFTLTAGGAAGALTGFVSHYLCWYLFNLATWLSYRLSGVSNASLGEAPLDPIQALWGAFVFSLWSWLGTGWITLPLGALLGAALTGFLVKKGQ